MGHLRGEESPWSEIGVRRVAGTLLLAAIVSSGLSAAKGQSQSSGPGHILASPEARARLATAWNTEALDLYAKGDYYQASQYFGKVYSLYPRNPDVAFNLGLALQALGRAAVLDLN